MTLTPDADPRLTGAHDIARAALAEITPSATVGEAAGYTVEDDGSVSLRFENKLDGYPGWFWTVTVAVTDDAEPTVLELELLPGEGALLAPDWVPWAERLAEYRAAAAAAAEVATEGAAASDDDDDDDDDTDDDLDEDDLHVIDDLDDLDVSEFDEDGSPHLHSGDLDGVDIDELDDSNDEDDSNEDDPSDEEE